MQMMIFQFSSIKEHQEDLIPILEQVDVPETLKKGDVVEIGATQGDDCGTKSKNCSWYYNIRYI